MSKNIPIKLTAFLVALAVFLAVGIASVLLSGAGYGNASLGQSGISESDSGIYVTIVKPSGWKTKETSIKIEVNNTQNRLIKAVRVKNGEKGTWTNVTQDPYIEISENSTVYVEVEDRDGNVVSKSRYLEIFDREKPTVKASLSGRVLKVTANDTISGVRGIYINGEYYDELTNDSISVTINKSFGEDITIQAEDFAGNMSQTYTTKNPIETRAALSSVSAADSPEMTGTAQSGAAATTTASTSEQVATAEEKKTGGASEAAAAAAGQKKTDDAASSSEGSGGGSATSDDDVIVGTFEDTKKQFMSVETKEGQVFYLIIDHDKDSNNVYFLTEITLSDLNPVAAPDGSAESSIGVASEEDTDTLIDGGMSEEEVELILNGGDTASTATDGTADSINEDENGGVEDESAGASGDGEEAEAKKNPIPGWIVIAALVGIVAFGGYMYFVFLPKKRAKEAYIDDEEEESAEPYDTEYPEYEDFTNTDDLEDATEEVTAEDVQDPSEDDEEG